MPVTINKTDGTVLATLTDGAINVSASGLTLVGNLYRGYGEVINENFVKLLENFSNSSAPTVPLVGQLWYDTADKKIKVYRSTGFVPLGVTVSSSAEPTAPTVGDLWWDTADRQLKLYNGTAWIVISPGYSTAQGISGAIVETIRDTTTTDHTITKVYHGGTVIATFNKDNEYIPSLPITGFSQIKKGITLSSAAGIKLYGEVESLSADLAEKYTVEKEWPIGTAMAVSDSNNFETEPAKAGSHCIGVISNNPAYLMNAESNGQAIALKGRVPVRVTGPVKKGQAVYAWSNGVCSTVETVALVGVALESNYNTVEKLVECVLKV